MSSAFNWNVKSQYESVKQEETKTITHNKIFGPNENAMRIWDIEAGK